MLFVLSPSLLLQPLKPTINIGQLCKPAYQIVPVMFAVPGLHRAFEHMVQQSEPQSREILE
jgi:hypothetical protein